MEMCLHEIKNSKRILYFTDKGLSSIPHPFKSSRMPPFRGTCGRLAALFKIETNRFKIQDSIFTVPPKMMRKIRTRPHWFVLNSQCQKILKESILSRFWLAKAAPSALRSAGTVWQHPRSYEYLASYLSRTLWHKGSNIFRLKAATWCNNKTQVVWISAKYHTLWSAGWEGQHYQHNVAWIAYLWQQWVYPWMHFARSPLWPPTPAGQGILTPRAQLTCQACSYASFTGASQTASRRVQNCSKN